MQDDAFTSIRDLIKNSWLTNREERRKSPEAQKKFHVPFEIIVGQYAASLIEAHAEQLNLALPDLEFAIVDLAMGLEKFVPGRRTGSESIIPAYRWLAVPYLSLNELEDFLDAFHQEHDYSKAWKSFNVDLNVVTLKTLTYVNDYAVHVKNAITELATKLIQEEDDGNIDGPELPQS